MGGLISGKVNGTIYPTKDDRFSCFLNVEHSAENVNESKYSARYIGNLGRYDTAEVDNKQRTKISI
jgi:hypothetical protein